MEIEIEKRFTIDTQEMREITRNARFLKRTRLTDIYYDTSDHQLTKQDAWLRSRDDKFELKYKLNHKGNKIGNRIDHHKELNTEREIRDFIGLKKKGNFEQDLKERGYLPFAKIVTVRKIYKKGELTIALDIMDFGYQIAEIEIVVRSENEIAIAENKILDFANRYKLISTNARGKALEYIARNNPAHFRSLFNAGIASF
jgi:predicted adenylyl cyclase CyaB